MIYGLAAVAAALLFVSPTPSDAFGDKCYPALKAKGGKEHSMRAARHSAIHAWEHAAEHKYGDHYNSWHYSGDRAIDCKWDKAGRHFWCTASARPCGH
jgi:hypothetical protein